MSNKHNDEARPVETANESIDVLSELVSAVEVFPWNPRFEVGIAVIDDQHRTLVRLLNQAVGQLICGGPRASVKGLAQLTAFIDFHFASEERVWRAALGDHPWAAEHESNHLDFQRHLADSVLSNEPAVQDGCFEDLAFYLIEWLTMHILGDDRRMAMAVKFVGSGSAVEEAVRRAERETACNLKFVVAAVMQLYRENSKRSLELVREISRRQNAERELRLARNLFNQTVDAICIVDRELTITYANSAMTNAMSAAGWNGGLVGENLSRVKAGFAGEALRTKIWGAVVKNGSWSGEVASRAPNGALEVDWVAISVIDDRSDKRFAVVFSNVSQILTQQKRLMHLANYDQLTNLPNRHLLSDRLAVAMANARRRRQHLAVCFVDLDGFKQINDRLGHAVGDRVLVETTARIRTALRSNDTIARWGGDEFVLLIGELDDAKSCEPVLDRLLEIISAPQDYPELTAESNLRVSASIGVSFFPVDSISQEALFENADRAMYEAKRLGGARYQLFSRILAKSV